MQGVIDMANAPVGTDPASMGRWAGAEEAVVRSNADPFGPGTSPDVRAKAQLSRILDIKKQRDQAMRGDYHDSQNMKFAQKTTAAAMTMPQMVQTGGSSHGTSNTVQGQNFWATAAPMVGGIAQGAGTAIA